MSHPKPIANKAEKAVSILQNIQQLEQDLNIPNPENPIQVISQLEREIPKLRDALPVYIPHPKTWGETFKDIYEQFKGGLAGTKVLPALAVAVLLAVTGNELLTTTISLDATTILTVATNLIIAFPTYRRAAKIFNSSFRSEAGEDPDLTTRELVTKQVTKYGTLLVMAGGPFAASLYSFYAINAELIASEASIYTALASPGLWGACIGLTAGPMLVEAANSTGLTAGLAKKVVPNRLTSSNAPHIKSALLELGSYKENDLQSSLKNESAMGVQEKMEKIKMQIKKLAAQVMLNINERQNAKEVLEIKIKYLETMSPNDGSANQELQAAKAELTRLTRLFHEASSDRVRVKRQVEGLSKYLTEPYQDLLSQQEKLFATRTDLENSHDSSEEHERKMRDINNQIEIINAKIDSMDPSRLKDAGNLGMANPALILEEISQAEQNRIRQLMELKQREAQILEKERTRLQGEQQKIDEQLAGLKKRRPRSERPSALAKLFSTPIEGQVNINVAAEDPLAALSLGDRAEYVRLENERHHKTVHLNELEGRILPRVYLQRLEHYKQILKNQLEYEKERIEKIDDINLQLQILRSERAYASQDEIIRDIMHLEQNLKEQLQNLEEHMQASSKSSMGTSGSRVQETIYQTLYTQLKRELQDFTRKQNDLLLGLTERPENLKDLAELQEQIKSIILIFPSLVSQLPKRQQAALELLEEDFKALTRPPSLPEDIEIPKIDRAIQLQLSGVKPAFQPTSHLTSENTPPISQPKSSSSADEKVLSENDQIIQAKKIEIHRFKTKQDRLMEKETPENLKELKALQTQIKRALTICSTMKMPSEPSGKQCEEIAELQNDLKNLIGVGDIPSLGQSQQTNSSMVASAASLALRVEALDPNWLSKKRLELNGLARRQANLLKDDQRELKSLLEVQIQIKNFLFELSQMPKPLSRDLQNIKRELQDLTELPGLTYEESDIINSALEKHKPTATPISSVASTDKLPAGSTLPPEPKHPAHGPMLAEFNLDSHRNASHPGSSPSVVKPIAAPAPLSADSAKKNPDKDSDHNNPKHS